MKLNLNRILAAILFGVAVYGAYAVYSGLAGMRSALAEYSWSTFAAACALAFGNYVLRFIKWEFYLARLGIRGVRKTDSFLTFLSGFILTITPGKVGEVFKSLVLYETYDVPIAKTAPIVVADRVTDLIGIIVLITIGSLGFAGGLPWAAAGTAVVGTLLVVVASRRLAHTIIGWVERMPGYVGKVGPRLYDAYESLATIVSAKNLIFPALLSIVAWGLECVSLWVILRGFGEQTKIELCMFFYATSTLAGALVPIPGGLGITEGLLRSQLHNLGGVRPETSTAAMMLVRFSTLWFAVLIGFLALTLLKRRYPKLLASESPTPAIATNE